jgi:hypothetical protein
VPDVLLWLESTTLSAWVRESGSLWAYPTILTAHTVGMSLLVGANTAIDLRLLGVAPQVPLAPLARVFRILWAGAAMSVGSGLLLFAADASTKGATTVFFVKLACIAAAALVAWRVQRMISGLGAEAGSVVPGLRILAVVSLALWVGAIAAGRLMAYLTPGPS